MVKSHPEPISHPMEDVTTQAIGTSAVWRSAVAAALRVARIERALHETEWNKPKAARPPRAVPDEAVRPSVAVTAGASSRRCAATPHPGPFQSSC